MISQTEYAVLSIAFPRGIALRDIAHHPGFVDALPRRREPLFTAASRIVYRLREQGLIRGVPETRDDGGAATMLWWTTPEGADAMRELAEAGQASREEITP